jgi:hypothetical protein
MSKTIWRRDDNWVGSEIEDSFVMVNVDTGSYVALNRTAHAIWQALEAPATVCQIASNLVERFDVSRAECEAAVVRLLKKMQELELAVARPLAD